MKQLPLPVRVAAGLAVTAVDRARNLPEKLAELPVTVVSQALQLSMRLQQQVTELAIKGDDALATFRPVEETPEWARFDEDEPAETDSFPDPTRRNGAVSRFDAVGSDESDDAANESLDAVMEGGARPDADAAAIGGVATGTGTETDDDIADAVDTAARLGVDAEIDAEAVAADRDADADADGEADGDPWAAEQRALADVHADGEFDSAPPAALPSYPDLSVPQLRARLRRLTEQDLTDLLDYERAHGNRPEYTGMLTRRIATVRDQR